MPKLGVEQLDLAGSASSSEVDFNVPLKDGRVSDDTRIVAALSTVQHTSRRAPPSCSRHISAGQGQADPAYSTGPWQSGSRPWTAVPWRRTASSRDGAARAGARTGSGILLLENLRFHAEEEANDEAFARGLALAESTSTMPSPRYHRAASIDAITRFLSPAAAGLL